MLQLKKSVTKKGLTCELMGALKLSWPEGPASALKVVYRSLELCQKMSGSYYPFGMAMEGSWQNYDGNPEGNDFLPPVPGDENDNYTYKIIWRIYKRNRMNIIH